MLLLAKNLSNFVAPLENSTTCITTTLGSQHISIARMVSDTAYSGDRIYRILNWLQSKNAIKICDENPECFDVTCESFDNALVDIRKFVL